MATIQTACTRGRRGLQTAAALTVFFFGAAQAQAQGPAPTPPVAPAPGPAPAPAPGPRTTPGPTVTPGPSTTPGPGSTPTPTRATPPTSATPAPTPDDRSLDSEIPQSIEGPATAEPPTEPVPPPDVAAEPPTPTEPTPPPEPVGPAPPATPTEGPAANDGNLVVKDQQQANDLRRKGLAVMVTGGVVTLAGVATSIAFTIRGTQYENLLVQTEEEYNRSDCSGRPTIEEGSKCDLLGKQRARNQEGIEFGDRATRAAGAAIAAGVVVTVVGGIIYRLGINKLRSGDVARLRMTPAVSRNFGGLMLTGRF